MTWLARLIDLIQIKRSDKRRYKGDIRGSWFQTKHVWISVGSGRRCLLEVFF